MYDSGRDYRMLVLGLDGMLLDLLAQRGDDFLPGGEYVRRAGYTTDDTGTVPYKN